MAAQPRPSKQDIESAAERAAAAEKVAALRPSLDDYVSEGVLPYKPDGKFSIPVDGKRVLQMNEQANRLAAWHGDNQAESPARRRKREAREERMARKNHRPRASIIVPELPWKKKRRKKKEDA